MWNSVHNDLHKVEDFRVSWRLVENGAALRANVQCAKTNQFYFCLYLCFPLVCYIHEFFGWIFHLACIFSLLCFLQISFFFFVLFKLAC